MSLGPFQLAFVPIPKENSYKIFVELAQWFLAEMLML